MAFNSLKLVLSMIPKGYRTPEFEHRGIIKTLLKINKLQLSNSAGLLVWCPVAGGYHSLNSEVDNFSY